MRSLIPCPVEALSVPVVSEAAALAGAGTTPNRRGGAVPIARTQSSLQETVIEISDINPFVVKVRTETMQLIRFSCNRKY